MRLVTVRTAAGTRAGRLTGAPGSEPPTAVLLDAPDVGALLADPDGLARAAGATGPEVTLTGGDLAPVVPRPGKMLCVGLNYRTHIREMGRELPDYPTLFATFPEALVGPDDPILLDPASDAVDWEAELGLVVGRRVRRAGPDEAAAAIAGFTVVNDVTMRDWQYRSVQWLQGKTFESSTPIGPALVTPDELPGGVRPALRLTCTINGELVQQADTSDLVFDPVALVSYVSQVLTLSPGDVIATGTPGGVGHARTPARYLLDGDEVVTSVEGLGVLRNRAVRPAATGRSASSDLPGLAVAPA